MSRKSSKATTAAAERKFEFVESLRVDPKTLRIAADPSQPFYDPAHRHDLPLSPAMLASVQDKGVVESIATTVVDGERWVMNGRQRTRHACAVNLAEVPINVYRVVGHDAIDAAMIVMELNRTSQGVADIDASRVAAEFLAAGKSRESIAQSMGITESKLDALLLLSQSSEETKKAVADGVISTSAAAIIARKSPELQKAVIDSAVAGRAELNAQAEAEGKKPEAPTGTATNIDVRKELAKAQGKELPQSAKRETEKKAEKAATGPRTGSFNKEECERLRDNLQAALVRCAADKDASLMLRGALAAVSVLMTGDAGPHGDKCAAIREAAESVRK